MAMDVRVANAKRRIVPWVATVDTVPANGGKGFLIECFMSLRGVKVLTECAVIERGADFACRWHCAAKRTKRRLRYVTDLWAALG
jgi:hypothetical protein